VGIKTIIRIGTCGAIQNRIKIGDIIISQAALCRQGAANDIAPPEYPAVADPFLTVALVKSAQFLGVNYHLGITASVDSFYEDRKESCLLLTLIFSAFRGNHGRISTFKYSQL